MTPWVLSQGLIPFVYSMIDSSGQTCRHQLDGRLLKLDVHPPAIKDQVSAGGVLYLHTASEKAEAQTII